MKRLKAIKESLVECVESQVHGHLEEVDTKELGEAIDMIKDLAKAIYYCTVTEAMEKGSIKGDHSKKHWDMEEECKLEEYMEELETDIMEMMMKATPDEKMLLQKKLNTLATKIK